MAYDFVKCANDMTWETILDQLTLTDEFVNFEAFLNYLTLSFSPKVSCVEICHLGEYEADIDHEALILDDLKAFLIVDCGKWIELLIQILKNL